MSDAVAVEIIVEIELGEEGRSRGKPECAPRGER